ncbi:MAG: hypothetical protein IPI51_13660 [Betaproteobacteria bacterium]|nr:hypothetical protein [Betaproteobacteria bacterium]
MMTLMVCATCGTLDFSLSKLLHEAPPSDLAAAAPGAPVDEIGTLPSARRRLLAVFSVGRLLFVADDQLQPNGKALASSLPVVWRARCSSLVHLAAEFVQGVDRLPLSTLPRLGEKLPRTGSLFHFDANSPA